MSDDTSPQTRARAAVGAQISHAAAARDWTIAHLARAAGVTDKTMHRIAKGQATRITNTTKWRIEQALGWPPGEIDKRLAQAEQELADDQQESSTMTEYGRLTWTDNPDGTRNYRLSRHIGGAERGFTIDNSSLSPDEALEDLRRGLTLLDALYTTGT